MHTTSEMFEESQRLSRLLDEGLYALRTKAAEAAEAEREYRKAKATAWMQAPEGTVPQREAHVNGVTADLRYARDLADGLRQAALEAVRSRRTQITLMQTMVNAFTEEAGLAKYGPSAA